MAATGIMTATPAEPRSVPDVRRRRFARADRTTRRVERGETIAPAALPDLRLAVDRILPGRAGGDDARRTTR